MTATALIQGHAGDGYGKVADVFAGNFAVGADVGAAFTLYVASEKVVDLWGGLADEARAGTHTDTVLERAYTMGGAFDFPVDRDGIVTFNDARIQAAEIPGAAGVSTARGLARLYAGCVSAIDGPQLLTRETIDDAVTVRSEGPQLFGQLDTGHRWGTGFMLNSPPARPMLGEHSFGHDGAGGHLAFGDDNYQAGFGYVVGQMGGAADERAYRLTDAARARLDT